MEIIRAVAALVFCVFLSQAFGAGAENIRLNQIGFYQYGPKRAVIISSQAWRFTVKSTDLSVTYFSGDVQPSAKWAAAGEDAAIADFSNFTRIGTYVIEVAGVGISYPFRIDAAVHADLTRGLLRAFYYQRASTNLPAQYAGKWARAAGHPDDQVIVHASAASDSSFPHGRKAADILSSPKGWYDAGDYGKYVVNAGITVYTLLSLYERFSGYFDSISLNIPPVSPGLPDVLSEVKWELDWLLTMQDPSDGGVYHKLTSLDFCGFIMPQDDRADRYVIGKGSAATFDFAAVCAVAYRVYKNFLPSFADSCLAAARYAWSWGSDHPSVIFRNPSNVLTGEYGDGNLSDERQWAAIELLLATGDTLFQPQAFKSALAAQVPGWPNVSTLGTYSLAFVSNDSGASARNQIKAQADVLATYVDGSPFHTAMYDQFYWGSNGLAANDGMLFVEAFLATKNPIYFERAVQVLDYLVGRNALGYSFVTGFGSLSPRHPHHRPSSADGIDEPVPGFLVGGPNAGRQDATSCGTAYPSAYPAKSWIDAECAYACNEVAINWNAPAAFLAGAIEAIYADTACHVQTYMHDTLPPDLSAIIATAIGPDRATITWKTDRDVSASVVYGVDSLRLMGGPLFSNDARNHSVPLKGLLPSSTYFFKVSAVDAFGAVSMSDIRRFTTSSSSLLEGFSFNPAGLTVAPGTALPITFSARTGLQTAVVYSAGGSKIGTRIACTQSGGTFSAAIPGSAVTVAGILMSITLADSVDSIATPIYALNPSAPVVAGYSLVYPKTFQLVSFPLLYANADPRAFFTSQLGDKSQWRYFGYGPDSAAYTTTDSLTVGSGGWLYSTLKKTITVQGVAVKPDSLFAIRLKRGWNLIGSPFTFPVYWENSLVRDNGVVLRLYDKASGQSVRRQLFLYSDTTCDQINNGRYISNADALNKQDTSQLAPWKGYWVYAEKSGVELLINPSAIAPPAVLAKKSSAGEKSGWRMHFSASITGSLDNTAVIGASPEASDDYDELDSPKPPLISNEVSVGLQRPQWKQHGTVFAADIVAAGTGLDHEWHVQVSTRDAGGAVKLAWQQTGNTGGYVYLYDSVSRVCASLTSSGEYTINLASGETRRDLTIRFSTHADKSIRVAPLSWSLGHCAPNPFKTSAVISYCVPVGPASAAARPFVLAVYDMLGRQVKTLVSGRATAGSYSLIWNGTDDGGRRLRQGVYVIHLGADGFSTSVKTQILD